MSEYMVTSEYITVWVGDLPDLKRGEEIVRCRDCEHHDHGRCYASQWSTASLLPPHKVSPDGFCAWGERRDA